METGPYDQVMAQEIAKMLLEIKAVQLNLETPFIWSSGWKSPIYCDNRLSLSFPRVRDYIKQSFVLAIRDRYPDVEGIAAVATAGIPQGALIADELDLPLVYVRSKPKGHGMENQIEGQIVNGQKVVVIEDLISTGGSSLRACRALMDAGMEVLGMATIFTYQFEIASRNFQDMGVELTTLSDYPTLIQEAVAKGYVRVQDLQSLAEWRKDPDNWKP